MEFAADGVAPMPAFIEQYMDIPVFGARNDNRILPDLCRLVIARVFDFADMADIDPGLLENPQHFLVENSLVGVDARVDTEIQVGYRHAVGKRTVMVNCSQRQRPPIAPSARTKK